MKKLLLFFIGSILCLDMHAQDGQLDPTFGTGGKTTCSFGNQFSDYATDQAIQSDGKIICTGYSADGNTSVSDFAACRYNSNGTPDLTYGNNGKVRIHPMNGFDCLGEACTLQSGGKLLIAGECNDTATINPQNGYATIIQLDANGNPDPGFGNNGIVAVQLNLFNPQLTTSDILVQPDGKIVISCYAEITMNDSNMIFMRFLPNGSPDSSFGQNGISIIHTPIQATAAMQMFLNPDGTITVCGLADYSSFNKPIMTRLQTNGSVDLNFGMAGFILPVYGFSSGFFSITTQPDGRILAGGFGQNGGLLVRYYDDGLPDPTFGVNGALEVNINGNFGTVFEDILIQPDGKILASGAGDIGWGLIRCDTNGVLDNNFGNAGIVETIFANSFFCEASGLAQQSDGKILVSGGIFTSNINMPGVFGTARYTNQGVSIHEENFSPFTVFPNPATDQIHLAGNISGAHINMLDITGRTVAVFTLNAENSTLDISGLHAGTYLLEMVMNGQQTNVPVMISH